MGRSAFCLSAGGRARWGEEMGGQLGEGDLLAGDVECRRLERRQVVGVSTLSLGHTGQTSFGREVWFEGPGDGSPCRARRQLRSSNSHSNSSPPSTLAFSPQVALATLERTTLL